MILHGVFYGRTIVFRSFEQFSIVAGNFRMVGFQREQAVDLETASR